MDPCFLPPSLSLSAPPPLPADDADADDGSSLTHTCIHTERERGPVYLSLSEHRIPTGEMRVPKGCCGGIFVLSSEEEEEEVVAAVAVASPAAVAVAATEILDATS